MLFSTPDIAIVGLEAAETQIRSYEATAIYHMVQYADARTRLQAQFPGEAWIDELDEAILNRTGEALRIARRIGESYDEALVKRGEKWTDEDNDSSPIPKSKRDEAVDAVAMSVHANYATAELRRPYSFVPNANSFREWQSVLKKKYGKDFERIGHSEWEFFAQNFLVGPRDKVAVEILDKHMNEHGITYAAVVFGAGHAKGLIKHFKELGYNIIAFDPFEGATSQYEKEQYEMPFAELRSKSEQAKHISEVLPGIPRIGAPLWRAEIESDDVQGIHLPKAIQNDGELRLSEEAGSMVVTDDENSD
jgi:hypothetical protein